VEMLKAKTRESLAGGERTAYDVVADLIGRENLNSPRSAFALQIVLAVLDLMALRGEASRVEGSDPTRWRAGARGPRPRRGASPTFVPPGGENAGLDRRARFPSLSPDAESETPPASRAAVARAARVGDRSGRRRAAVRGRRLRRLPGAEAAARRPQRAGDP